MSSATKRKITYRKLTKLNTIWHPESTLVFKSQKDKLVTGRLDESNEFIEFDNICSELCDQWSFKPDDEALEAFYAKEGELEVPEEGVDAEEGEVPVEGVDEEDGVDDEDGDIKAPEKGVEVDKVQEKHVKSSYDEHQIGANLSCLTLVNSIKSDADKLYKYVEEERRDTQRRIDLLEKSLATEKREREELLDKYNAMKVKFDTMKSLFS